MYELLDTSQEKGTSDTIAMQLSHPHVTQYDKEDAFATSSVGDQERTESRKNLPDFTKLEPVSVVSRLWEFPEQVLAIGKSIAITFGIFIFLSTLSWI